MKIPDIGEYGKISRTNSIGPYFSRFSHFNLSLRGNIPVTNLNPSSGAIGIRLNKASAQLIIIKGITR